MRVKALLHQKLIEVLGGIHKKRRESITSLVLAGLAGASLTVTSLGRGIASRAREKHCIKRADRLLSNCHLHQELNDIYQALARDIIKSSLRPIIIVDWSVIDELRGLFLLRASIPTNGRAVTIYEEVHSLKNKEKPRVHRKFLSQISKFLPQQSRPIVITDAGFRTPWFKEVQRLGWDWVGRIRNRHKIKIEDNWFLCKELYQHASKTSRLMGHVTMTQNNPICCQLVLFKAPARGRKAKNLKGTEARCRQSRKHAACQREPWLLATSLTEVTAKQIVKLYKTRMQIEEAFRDLKCPRFGLSLDYSRTRILNRMSVLVLIGTLIHWLSWLLGTAVKISGQHRHLQANSVRHRLVLSPVFIGLRTFRDTKTIVNRIIFDIAANLLTASCQAYV